MKGSCTANAHDGRSPEGSVLSQREKRKAKGKGKDNGEDLIGGNGNSADPLAIPTAPAV